MLPDQGCENYSLFVPVCGRFWKSLNAWCEASWSRSWRRWMRKSVRCSNSCGAPPRDWRRSSATCRARCMITDLWPFTSTHLQNYLWATRSGLQLPTEPHPQRYRTLIFNYQQSSLTTSREQFASLRGLISARQHLGLQSTTINVFFYSGHPTTSLPVRGDPQSINFWRGFICRINSAFILACWESSDREQGSSGNGSTAAECCGSAWRQKSSSDG